MASRLEEIRSNNSFLFEPQAQSKSAPVDIHKIERTGGSNEQRSINLGIVTGQFDDLSNDQFKNALADEFIGSYGEEGKVFTRDNFIGRWLGSAEGLAKGAMAFTFAGTTATGIALGDALKGDPNTTDIGPDFSRYSNVFWDSMGSAMEAGPQNFGFMGIKLFESQTYGGQETLAWLDENFFQWMSEQGVRFGNENFEITGSPLWATIAQSSFELGALTAPILGAKGVKKIGDMAPWQAGGRGPLWYAGSKEFPGGDVVSNIKRAERIKERKADPDRLRVKTREELLEESLDPKNWAMGEILSGPLWSFKAFKDFVKRTDPKLSDEAILAQWDSLKDMHRKSQSGEAAGAKKWSVFDDLQSYRGDLQIPKRTAKDRIELEPMEVIGERPKITDIPEISSRSKEGAPPPDYTRIPMPFGAFRVLRGTNKRTGRPLSMRALLRSYTKYVNDFIAPAWTEKIWVPSKSGRSAALREVPRGILAKNYNDSVIKGRLIYEAHQVVKQLKNEQGLIDPGTRPQTAIGILKDLIPSLKNDNGITYTANSKNPTFDNALESARTKGEDQGILSKGYMDSKGKWYSTYEIQQLKEIAATKKPAKIETSSEKNLNELVKDPSFAADTPFMKRMLEGDYTSPLEVSKIIAKGAENFKEFKTKFEQEFEGTPYLQYTKRFFELTRQERAQDIKKEMMGGEVSGKDIEIAEVPGTPGGINVSTKWISPWKWVQEVTFAKSLNRMKAWYKFPTGAKLLDMVGIRDPHRGSSTVEESLHQARLSKTGDHVSEIDAIYEKYMGVWFSQFRNVLSTRLGGFSGAKLIRRKNLELTAALEGDTSVKVSPKMQQMATELRSVMDKIFKDYVKDPKANIGDVKYLENYLHRVYDTKAIRNNREAFTDLIEEHYLRHLKNEDFKPEELDVLTRRARNSAEEAVEKILDGKGTIPFETAFKSAENLMGEWASGEVRKRVAPLMERTLKDIPAEKIKDYMVDNTYHRMIKGIEDTVSRIEYSKRFGANNEKVYPMLKQLATEMSKSGRDITQREINNYLNLLEAHQHLLGRAMHPGVKRSQQGWLSFLNFAILPLATVASTPEIVLPLYHGGVKAYAKGIGTELGVTLPLQILKLIKRDAKWFGVDKTRSMQMAAEIRKAGDIAAMERMNQLFAGDFTAFSNVVFRINMLYYWTKFMNGLAVGTYDIMVQNYFKDKAAGKRPGLSKGEEGRMNALIEYYGLDLKQGINWVRAGAPLKGEFYKKLKAGAITFAEDSVLTPNPSTMPLWHSNPNFAVFKHLKSFPTLIGNKVLSRWYRDTRQEFRNKDVYATGMQMNRAFSAGGAMLLLAHLSNVITDEVRYGGRNPIYSEKFGKGLTQHIIRAVERAGFLGMGNFVFDAIFHAHGSPLTTAAGPTASKLEALINAVRTGNSGPISKELAKLTPIANVNREYMEWWANLYEENLILPFTPFTKKKKEGGRRSRRPRTSR